MKYRIAISVLAVLVVLGVWAAKTTTPEQPPIEVPQVKPGEDDSLKGFKIP